MGALTCAVIGTSRYVTARRLQSDTPPTAFDRVAYTTFRPDNWDIYLLSTSGAPPKRLTTGPGLDYDAAVSPDGRWLVFCSERRGNPDLYVLDLERGGDPHLLIDSSSMEDQPAFSPDGTHLAFVSTHAGNADIYLVPFRPGETLSMTNAKNLTHHPGGDFRPAFSPDGRKLAFSSDRDAPINAINPITRLRSGDIYVLDLIDERLQRLTDAPGWDGSPAWSPDGHTIVFYSQRGLTATFRDPRARIWAMDADGAHQRVLTADETLAFSPAFLSDGRVVYSRKGSRGLWEIVSMNADGSNARVESGTSTESFWKPSRGPSAGTIVAHGTAASASLSPQGLAGGFGNGNFLVEGAPFITVLPDRTIGLYPLRYFTAALNPKRDLVLLTHPAGGTEMLVSRTDGSEPRTVFHYDSTQNTFAGLSWSRDGEWIVFTRGASRTPVAEADIWKMRADGSEQQNLTPQSAGNDSYPSFSGDDKRIVFRSGRSGQFDLYVMNADGTQVRRLTNDTAEEIFPVFSPTANQIAFVSDRDKPGSGLFEVYLLDLNADDAPGRLRRVTHNDVQEGHLAFSYDGKWLIFSSEQGGINDEEPLVQSVVFGPQSYGDMYAYRIADETVIRLTHNKWEEGVPSWEAPLKQ
jgi:Tol biopolymer transport system component